MYDIYMYYITLYIIYMQGIKFNTVNDSTLAGRSVDLWSNRFSQNCENGKHVPIAIFNDRGIGKSPYYLV